MNWGKWIFVAFLIFGGVITTMVVISMNQDIDLVSKDYYEQEIKYQDKIDQMVNVSKLEKKPQLKVTENLLLLDFSNVEMVDFNSGKVMMFSPLSKDEDRVYTLNDSDFPAWQIKISDARKGRWQVKLEWKDGETAFFMESNITI